MPKVIVFKTTKIPFLGPDYGELDIIMGEADRDSGRSANVF